ncbi:MAG TPA: DUF6438 domain-containing protein [Terracidiphilus sp.]
MTEFALNHSRFCFWICLSLLLVLAGIRPACAQTDAEFFLKPPDGILIVGFRETATHRPEPQLLRPSHYHGLHESIDLWIHVDPQGRVLEVRGFDKTKFDSKEVIDAARRIQYSPFLRNGVPVEAWVQESIHTLTTEDKPAPLIPFPDVKDPSKIRIELSRSGCFGWCPSYSVSIDGNGEVIFDGGSFVSIPGEHKTHISPAAVAELLEKFRAANFLGLKDSYRGGVTDNPTYNLTLTLGETKKSIRDYVGGYAGMPSAVTELEMAVDRTADTARWVTSSPSTLEAMREAGIALDSPQAAKILRAAIDAGDVETVKSLLNAGTPLQLQEPETEFRLSSPSQRPDTSLLELVVQSDNAKAQPEMLRTLLAIPAINSDKSGKQRALGMAAEEGLVDIARILIAAGADPTARFDGAFDSKNETYLSLAATSGIWAMIDDALSRPHDIHAVDSEGRTALVAAAWSTAPREDIFPIIDRLLDAGADRSEIDRVLHDIDFPNWIPGLELRRKPKSPQSGEQYQSHSWVTTN